MEKKGIIVLAISLVIFVFAVIKASGIMPQNSSSSEKYGKFGVVYSRGDNGTINIKSNANLRFKVSSFVDKGSMTFSIVSPDNTVVYKNEGKEFHDMQTIPVTEGLWQVRMETDYAEYGSYYIKAEALY